MPSSECRRARRQKSRQDPSARNAAPPYVYSILPNSSSIRVLELLPSIDEHTRCALHIVDLEDKPVFDALSYCWSNPVTIRENPIPAGAEGLDIQQALLSLHSLPTASHPNVVNVDPGAMTFLSVHRSLPYMDREHGTDRCENITCDGYSIYVTGSLHSALRQLRCMLEQKAMVEKQGMTYLETLPVPRSKYIWIDQICIDQENLDERSAQIPLMNKIFTAAQYVFAWIGDLDDLGVAGFDVALARGRHFESDAKPEDFKVSYESLGRARKDLYSLTALLSRQWFRRAWVVQEAVFARRLYLWSGSIFMDWWILFSALQTLDDVDLRRMSKFMGSLIRREPTAQLSKRLARIRKEGGLQSSTIPAVTNEEILNNVKGAKSFMNGVIEIKRQLGLQCFDPGAANRSYPLDGELDSRFPSLVMGVTTAGGTQKHSQAVYLRSTQLEKYHTCLRGLSNTYFDQISAPFTSTTAVDQIELDIDKARINTAFYNHDLDPLDNLPPSPISLFSLITRFRDVGASDPRDKVFSFLHLATETPDLVPNYRASVQTVFVSATRMLLREHNLTVLSYVQDLADTKVHNLPSYVPDFSVPLGRTPLVAHDGSSPYAAGGSAFLGQPNFEFVAEHQETKERLVVMMTFGYFLDTVAELAETKGCYFARTGNLAAKTPEHYKNPSPNYTFKSRLFLRLGHVSRPTRVEALWRTLVADYSSNTYPAPVATGFGFSEWVSVHLHHSFHVKSMLSDHFAVATPSPPLLELEAAQKRKQDAYIQLAKDDPGGYLCYDCAQEFWDEKMQDVDKEQMKQLSDLNFIPTMNPVRYLPDWYRTSALFRCARTSPPRAHSTLSSNANCPVLEPEELERMTTFENRMRDVKAGRRMFRTKENLLGMGPKSTQEGDEVWVIMGAKVPFILRPVEGGKAPKRYRLVGEAFVLGYMDGEVLQEKRKLEAFGLI